MTSSELKRAGESSSSTRQVVELCVHCGLPIPLARTDSAFCCDGCDRVNKNIRLLGLEDFYRLRDGAELKEAVIPPSPVEKDYDYLDNDAVLEKLTARNDGSIKEVILQIDGIHCAGCVWLLEKIPAVIPGVLSTRLQVASGQLRVRFDSSQVRLSQIAGRLDSLGYPVSPAVATQRREGERKAERALLVRLGVAGFCAANVMMLAVSLYEGDSSGMEQGYLVLFRWGSLLLALPAVFFSAIPFYRAAWQGLKLGAPQIDLPIAIAIIIGFLSSAWNTFSGSSVIYFDSLSVLIFLLLGGRYLQLRAAQKARFEASCAWDILPIFAIRRRGESEEKVLTETLTAADEVIVRAGERVPVDGILVDGNCLLDQAVLTGESLPVAISPGSKIEAGSLNLESTIIVGVLHAGAATRLGRVMRTIQESVTERPRVIALTDIVSRYFVIIVVSLATLTFAYWYTDGAQIAVNHAVSLLIVTCPCALGLAVPVSISVALARAAKAGILIKQGEAIEKIARARNVFLDKTGTLSKGTISVTREILHPNNGENSALSVHEALRPLLSQSTHPVSRAVGNFIGDGAEASFEKISVYAGRGVKGIETKGVSWRIGSQKWLLEEGIIFDSWAEKEIKALAAKGLGVVYVSKGSKLEVLFGLEDPLQDEVGELIDELKEEKREIYILSGDHNLVLRRVGEELNLASDHCLGECYPEDKKEIVQKKGQSTIFIGDGINDALAMKSAGVAIGMKGGVEATLEVADVFIAEGGVRNLRNCFHGATRTLNTIKSALVFSLVYNIVGGGLAITGQMTPLLAAVLMPFSSLSVIGLAVLSKNFSHSEQNK